MNYHLSPRIILTTMQALAAVQAMAANDEERAVLAPILCRERTHLLAVMIRNAFADTVMRLGPVVTDVSLGDESADTPAAEGDTAILDTDLAVELVTPRSFTTGRHTAIRRALEQGVAFTALGMWSAASAVDDVGRELADRFPTIARDWYKTLTTALTPDFTPTVTDPY